MNKARVISSRCALFLVIFLFFAQICIASDLAQEPKNYYFDKSGPITICFSPGGDCSSIIHERIENAKKSIRIAIYSFTNLDISRSLISAHRRGVDIKIVTDRDQSDDKYSKIQFLIDSGIPVVIGRKGGKLHHKFAVFDGRYTITGSYNWSLSAENKNDENMLLIDSPEISRAFLDEFDRMWKEYR